MIRENTEQMPLWKECTISPLYHISSDGQLYSSRKNKLLKGGINSCGYKFYYLTTNGGYSNDKGKWIFAHRLVAQHFIPNPNNLPEVNHIDGNKLNNNTNNLEWCTHKQNIKHSFTLERKAPAGENHHMFGKHHPKKVKERMSIAKRGKNHPKFKGYYIVNDKKFTSSTSAEKSTGISYKTIIRKCNKGVNGFSFQPVKRRKID